MAIRPVYAILQGLGIIPTAALQDDSVTNAKMAPDSVDTPELVDDAVTLPKIDPSAYSSSSSGAENLLVRKNGFGLMATAGPPNLATHVPNKAYVDGYFPVDTGDLANGAVTDDKTASNPPSFSAGNLRGVRFGGVVHLWTVGTGILDQLFGTSEFSPAGPDVKVPGVDTTGSSVIVTIEGGRAYTSGDFNTVFTASYEVS